MSFGLTIRDRLRAVFGLRKEKGPAASQRGHRAKTTCEDVLAGRNTEP